MDYKIYNIELVNRLLAWQHTAFKTKTSIPIALPDREQVPATEAGEPLPDQQEPVDPLNVITWDAADFVLCHKVHCSIGFQENHRLCRWDKKVILMEPPKNLQRYPQKQARPVHIRKGQCES